MCDKSEFDLMILISKESFSILLDSDCKDLEGNKKPSDEQKQTRSAIKIIYSGYTN